MLAGYSAGARTIMTPETKRELVVATAFIVLVGLPMLLVGLALISLAGCAEPPLCSPGMSVYHCVPAPFPNNARMDQGWLHERAILGCPGAIYVAPGGELQQCLY